MNIIKQQYIIIRRRATIRWVSPYEPSNSSKSADCSTDGLGSRRYQALRAHTCGRYSKAFEWDCFWCWESWVLSNVLSLRVLRRDYCVDQGLWERPMSRDFLFSKFYYHLNWLTKYSRTNVVVVSNHIGYLSGRSYSLKGPGKPAQAARTGSLSTTTCCHLYHIQST